MLSDSGISVSPPSKEKEEDEDQKPETTPLDPAVESRMDEGVASITEASPTEQSRTEAGPLSDSQNPKSLESNGSVKAPSANGDHDSSTQTKDVVPADVDPETGTLDEENMDGDDSIDEDDEQFRAKFQDFEKRLKLAPRRKKQYNQYINILEERISMLEERWSLFDKEKLKKGTENIKEPTPVPNPSEPPRLELALNFQFWPLFAKQKITHLIDVLLGEPEFANVKKTRRRTTWVRFGDSGQFPTSEEIFDDYASEQVPATDGLDLQNEVDKLRKSGLPERIRINAPAVLIIFHKVLGISCSRLPNVILRPFKAFFHNERQMRDTMTEILSALNEILLKRRQSEAKNDGGEQSEIKGEDARDNEEENENENENELGQAELQEKSREERDEEERKQTDSISVDEWNTVITDLDLYHCAGCTQIVHDTWPTLSDVKKSFETIYDLLDNFIKPVATTLRSRSAEKVRFRDLWHLFHIGDEIMVHENPKNEEENLSGKVALKVLRTSGGRRVSNIVGPVPYGDQHGRATSPEMVPPPPPPPPLPPPPPPPPFDPLDGILPKDRIPPVNGINPFCIHAYYLDFDGSKLVPVRRCFIIAPYAGERKIGSLAVYPIEYASGNDMSREALVVRGQKFVRYAKSKSVTYLDCTGLELRTKEELNDKVIVDMKEYFRIDQHRADIPVFDEPEELDNPDIGNCNCTYGPSCPHRHPFIIPDQPIDITVSEEYRATRPEFKSLISSSETDSSWLPEYSICHYRLFAYKLRSREWVAIDVDSLEPPNASEVHMGFKQLVLPDDHKDILESQVREHFRKRGAQASHIAAEDDMDLVRGKGQGLIILLHGAPGVGKTATAECIADLMAKPLYPITCGDLGSTAEEVEKNLKKHFTLASKWDCVMLLDEADVFLAKRKQADLMRNSIVSVFLRMLEYYKGLLFLTTNRVGTFDEAFKSRVHISLFYPNFDRDTTIRVWKTFIKQTRRALERNNRTGIRIDKEGILKFAKDHWKKHPDARWNGRQIRNAFHTAVAMAEFSARGGKLANGEYDQERDVKIDVGRAQFEKIANTVKEFDDYMREAIGMSYEAKAVKERMRARNLETSTKVRESSKKSKKKSQKKEDTEESSSEEIEEKVVRSKADAKKSRARVEDSDDDDDDDASSDED